MTLHKDKSIRRLTVDAIAAGPTNNISHDVPHLKAVVTTTGTFTDNLVGDEEGQQEVRAIRNGTYAITK